MSARPDLTTEELIRWCEECAHAINPPSYDALPYYRAIAQRLRSERPAVTPEMVMVPATPDWVVQTMTTAQAWQHGYSRALLSVSSTEGKHGQ